jgi:hypothetical protein
MDISNQKRIRAFAEAITVTETDAIREVIRDIFSEYAGLQGFSPVSRQVLSHDLWLFKMNRSQLEFYLLALYVQLIENPTLRSIKFKL